MTNGYIETLSKRLASELRCHAANAYAGGDGHLAFLLEKAAVERTVRPWSDNVWR